MQTIQSMLVILALYIVAHVQSDRALERMRRGIETIGLGSCLALYVLSMVWDALLTMSMAALGIGW
jgi:hypothetical protein